MTCPSRILKLQQSPSFILKGQIEIKVYVKESKIICFAIEQVNKIKRAKKLFTGFLIA